MKFVPRGIDGCDWSIVDMIFLHGRKVGQHFAGKMEHKSIETVFKRDDCFIILIVLEQIYYTFISCALE